MIFTSSTLYAEPGLDRFAVSYKVVQYIKRLIMTELFTPYGLADKDEDVDIGVSINVEFKTEKLLVTGPKLLHKKTTINYKAFFPYTKIKDAPDERAEYINVFFETIAIILPQYGIPIGEIDKTKALVFEELKNNPEEYVYTPQEKANLDEVLKELGYDKAKRTFYLPDGDKQVDP